MTQADVIEPVDLDGAGDTLPANARAVAIQAARAAGAILRGKVGQARNVEFKGLIDLVTDADRAAEDAVSARILSAFPDHRFLGEEGTSGSTGDSSYGWIVDPLDGTTNYAHGYPHFAVSIGLERHGEMVLGVIYDPMRDELFVGERGRGSELNGAPIQVTDQGDLIQSLLGTGFPYDPDYRAASLGYWNALMHACQGVRRDGSAALNLAWVAAGRLDGFYELPLKPWDMAAGALLVAEAGGVVTDFTGGAFDPYGAGVIATNGPMHEPLRSVLRTSAPVS